jgi:hypothetical protein
VKLIWLILYCGNLYVKKVLHHILHKITIGIVLNVLSLLKDGNDEMKFSESLTCSISQQFVKESWDTEKSI